MGDTINYGSFGTTADIDCADGKSLNVGGSNNTLTVKGSCASVNIGGANNKITFDNIGKELSVVGLNNTVTYKGGDPKVNNLGSGNTHQQGLNSLDRFAVPAGAFGEPLCAGDRLRGDSGEAAELEVDGLGSRCPHWCSCREPIGTQTGLRQRGQFRGQRLGRLRAPARRARRGWPARSPAPRRRATARPVRIMSIARLWPISRGRRTVPPSISGTPQRRQNTPKTASSSATRRSHHSASSSPPATA